MKKIVIILTVVLLIALMCSCNADNEAVVNENATVNDLHNITEDTQSEETNNLNETQSAEETTQAMVYENLVYTNMSLEKVTNAFDDDVLVEKIPDTLVLGTYITEDTLDVKMEGKKFTFCGETYDLDFQIARLKKLSEVNVNSKDVEYHYYKNEDANFRIVSGSNKLLGLSINDKKGYDASKKEVSIDEARKIADDFMKTYSLADSLDDYVVTYTVDEAIRFWYTLTIGGYRVREEYYVVGVNKNGEVWFYSDETSGAYDKFIGKVTDEDVEIASRGLSPTVPNSYGFSEPFLQIGSDGNLYLSVSCFADEEMWGEEVSFSYDFYSRVFYEE